MRRSRGSEEKGEGRLWANEERRCIFYPGEGVDYRHPAFRTPEGRTRILKIWDQSAPGTPPEGYLGGREYTREEIDRALSLPPGEAEAVVPVQDFTGHGTAVLGIAAASREEGGVYQGVAYDSDLLVVKMGARGGGSFPRTTELMMGVDYLVRQAEAYGRPIAINISYGNNYGSHRGDSLLETYLDNAAGVGRVCMVTGTGNNARDALHYAGRLQSQERQEISFSIGSYEPVMNLQLWKSYEDEAEIYLETPSGQRLGPLSEELGAQRYQGENTDLLVYYGKPGPYHVTQEIYVDFLPGGRDGAYVDSGVWKLILQGGRVRDGNYELWLPGGNVLGKSTGFYMPRVSGTLTIPSTAQKVISVGAYDPRSGAYADFSGRGSDLLPWQKPDLAAPGVAVTAPRPGGSYASFSGTSFAVPFVTGACALLMEWGILRGNDPYLYGEKVKAYLRRGARPLPGYEIYPNTEVGWGALCVRDSLPK